MHPKRQDIENRLDTEIAKLDDQKQRLENGENLSPEEALDLKQYADRVARETLSKIEIKEGVTAGYISFVCRILDDLESGSIPAKEAKIFVTDIIRTISKFD